jgi:hypothetical protein
MDHKEIILEGLKPLFEKARTEKLWFYSRHHDAWFSPNQLEESHKEGRFMWGAINWELRDPTEKIKELDDLIANIEKNKSGFLKEITQNQ